NVPLPVFGMTIDPPPVGAPCYDPVAKTYGAGCFDTLHIITLDPNPVYAQTTGSATSTQSITSSSLFVNPIPPATPDTLAAQFNPGNELWAFQVDNNGNITGMAQAYTTCTENQAQSQPNQTQVRRDHNPQVACASNPPMFDNQTNNKLGQTFTGGS